MTVVMPDLAPLPMPPGDPEAVAVLVRDVAGAAFWLATLGDRLAGPAASAPGWLGDDAAAAAAQVGRVAALTREATTAVLTVVGRLSTHAECLREARRRVRELRAEQQEDLRAAWEVLGRIDDYQVVATTDSPEAFAAVEEFESSEATRLRRHAALVQEVEDDAAATARVLADGCAVVGGRGRRGDAVRVLAHLAAELPGWGDLELARRGRAMADALLALDPPRDRDAAADQALLLARSGAFAEALLARLGVDGLRDLLYLLGTGAFGDDMRGEPSAVARLVATALGAAEADARPDDPVRAVLTGSYIDIGDEWNDADQVALGMATVLVARVGSAGLRPATVVAWGRQILAREYAQADSTFGGRAIDRAYPGVHEPVLLDRFDPVPLVVEALGRSRDEGAAASLLTGPHAWDALLARDWDDDGEALARLVERASAQPGEVGDRAVRLGLMALGSGLDDGDPEDWTVDRDTAAAVAPALGSAVAAHVSVATRALLSGADGDVSEQSGDVLRGLGYLTVDRDAAAVIADALHGWTLEQSASLTGTSPQSPLPAVAVPSAYVAVQQYGQRLPHALHGFEEQAAAERKKLAWDLFVGLPANFVPGPVGVGLGVVEGYAAMAFDTDGTWDNGADHGLVFDREDSADAALATLAAPTPEVEALLAQARVTFDATLHALGVLRAPEPPGTDALGPLLNGLPGFTREYVKRLPNAERYARFGGGTPD